MLLLITSFNIPFSTVRVAMLFSNSILKSYNSPWNIDFFFNFLKDLKYVFDLISFYVISYVIIYIISNVFNLLNFWKVTVFSVFLIDFNLLNNGSFSTCIIPEKEFRLFIYRIFYTFINLFFRLFQMSKVYFNTSFLDDSITNSQPKNYKKILRADNSKPLLS